MNEWVCFGLAIITSVIIVTWMVRTAPDGEVLCPGDSVVIDKKWYMAVTWVRYKSREDVDRLIQEGELAPNPKRLTSLNQLIWSKLNEAR